MAKFWKNLLLILWLSWSDSTIYKFPQFLQDLYIITIHNEENLYVAILGYIHLFSR